MQPLRARMDLGAMPMKEYSVFPKAPVLLEPYHQNVYCQLVVVGGGFLLLGRDAVGVFYSPSQLGWQSQRQRELRNSVLSTQFDDDDDILLLNIPKNFLYKEIWQFKKNTDFI